MEKQTMLKEYLKQLYHTDRYIVSTVEELNALRSSAAYQYSSGWVQNRVSSSHDTDPHFVRSVNKIVDYEAYLISEIEKYIDEKKRVHDLIMKLPDNGQILVMKCRYILFMEWDVVALEMNLSLKQVHRLHSSALHNLTKIWEPGSVA